MILLPDKCPLHGGINFQFIVERQSDDDIYTKLMTLFRNQCFTNKFKIEGCELDMVQQKYDLDSIRDNMSLFVSIKGGDLQHFLTCNVVINENCIKFHSIYPEHNKNEEVLFELLLCHDNNDNNYEIDTILSYPKDFKKKSNFSTSKSPENSANIKGYVKDHLGALCGLLSICSTPGELETTLAGYFANRNKFIKFSEVTFQNFDKKVSRILQKNSSFNVNVSLPENTTYLHEPIKYDKKRKNEFIGIFDKFKLDKTKNIFIDLIDGNLLVIEPQYGLYTDCLSDFCILHGFWHIEDEISVLTVSNNDQFQNAHIKTFMKEIKGSQTIVNESIDTKAAIITTIPTNSATSHHKLSITEEFNTVTEILTDLQTVLQFEKCESFDDSSDEYVHSDNEKNISRNSLNIIDSMKTNKNHSKSKSDDKNHMNLLEQGESERKEEYMITFKEFLDREINFLNNDISFKDLNNNYKSKDSTKKNFFKLPLLKKHLDSYGTQYQFISNNRSSSECITSKEKSPKSVGTHNLSIENLASEIKSPISNNKFESVESWSQLVDPKVLKKISPKEIKRQDIIYELIFTEFQYLKMLRTMRKVYYNGMISKIGISREFADSLMPKLDDLIVINGKFLADLRSLQNQNENYIIASIGKVIIDQFSGQCGAYMEQIYSHFISLSQQSNKLYKEKLKSHKKFSSFVEMCKSHPQLRRLSIPECILLVTQRPTKYPILIDAILVNTKDPQEIELLIQANVFVKTVLSNINSIVKQYINDRELDNIIARLDYRSEICFKEGRLKTHSAFPKNAKLIRNGNILARGRNRTYDVELIILMTRVLILHEKDQKLYLMVIDQKPPFILLKNIMVRSVATDPKAFFLVDKINAEMYEFVSPNPNETQSWMICIQEASLSSLNKIEQMIDTEEEVQNNIKRHKKIIEYMNQISDIDHKLCGLYSDRLKFINAIKSHLEEAHLESHVVPNSDKKCPTLNFPLFRLYHLLIIIFYLSSLIMNIIESVKELMHQDLNDPFFNNSDKRLSIYSDPNLNKLPTEIKAASSKQFPKSMASILTYIQRQLTNLSDIVLENESERIKLLCRISEANNEISILNFDKMNLNEKYRQIVQDYETSLIHLKLKDRTNENQD